MVEDRPSTEFPGEGCFMASVGGSGFAVWYRPETKEAARKVAEKWLADNAGA